LKTKNKKIAAWKQATIFAHAWLYTDIDQTKPSGIR